LESTESSLSEFPSETQRNWSQPFITKGIGRLVNAMGQCNPFCSMVQTELILH
jgi:hypothetical protein